MAVGASATFDPCAARDSETWPVRLQHWLGVEAPNRTFEVINAGVPGYLMLDNIIRLQQELYRFAPDVILLYAGHGTVNPAPVAAQTANGDAVSTPDTPDAAPTATPWGQWLGRHSLLYYAVMARLRAQTGEPVATPALSAPEMETAFVRASQDFRRDLVSFVLIAQSLGARVVLVELTHLSGSSTGNDLAADEAAVWTNAFATSPSVTLEGLRRFSEVQRTVADSLHATFVGTAGFGIARPEHYCAGDPLHLNKTGADLLARKLARAILADDAVKPSEVQSQTAHTPVRAQ